ncbi:alpha-L-fucosidase [Chitinophaga eiseniae]|uniref:alpha-L-fucosidase n=1 Tax=Chitinophaga eiseniae TaxID=634771 RepID=A0A847SM28_9BACT|nr:alpha-L-fucosidase [Chitinophaga eiseniae]NLR78426.1 alpha-L-fucosidase [Chitinophaga eiseniae]
MKKIRIICLFILTALNMQLSAQNIEPTWEELCKDYQFPKWYMEARFGIWLHWGAQSQPEEGGGWYARHMYMQNVGGETFGKNAYPYHVKTYGHPSDVGFKEVIHSWKAEYLDADALISYFKKVGAKYFIILANHHDHFDNFNSTYQKWNSVNVGPKRDIVGEFEKATRKYHLPFAVSSHDDRFLNWWLPAFGADETGPKKGIPYDGNLTKADGKGKWWEGLDPADLYGLPPAKRTAEWLDSVKQNYVNRMKELVTNYKPDMLWFDGYGFPYGKYGKEVCRTYLYNSLKEHGKVTAIVAGKIADEPSVVKDIECGTANKISTTPWQSIITTGANWFYKKDREMVHNSRTVIEMLTDVISKNGNLVLNIELKPNGIIPPEDSAILEDLKQWLHINGEAVYASKPWKIYGDNLNSFLKQANNITNADLEAVKKQVNSEQFNQRTVKSNPYGHDEVRFTTCGNHLYIFVLNPAQSEISLSSLGLNNADVKKIKTMKLLGSSQKINFRQMRNNLMIDVPARRPTNYCAVFKVTFSS